MCLLDFQTFTDSIFGIIKAIENDLNLNVLIFN